MHVLLAPAVPASGAQHLFLRQLLLQHWDPELHVIPVVQQPPSHCAPPPPELLDPLELRPPELLLVLADGGLLQALELSR